MCIPNLREKLHAKKYTKPILKNSDGASEKLGSFIHRFAPPAELTKELGKKCIPIISTRDAKNKNQPIFLKLESGLS